MNRLYAIESQFSITGAAADHRLPLQSSRIGELLAMLEQALLQLESDIPPTAAETEEASRQSRFVRAVADDLLTRTLSRIEEGDPQAAEKLLLLF